MSEKAEEAQPFQRCLEKRKYRIPLEVMEIVVHQDRCSYPICPRCSISIDREYQDYCDRCGQKLAWNLYFQDKAIIKYFLKANI